ncbi:MAG: hypothetical protein AAF936_17535 [Pseudomonadota bacterium]
MFEFAAMLLSASPVVTDVVSETLACYASKNEQSDQAIVITNEAKPELSSKGLRRVACPEALAWSPEAARQQCDFLAHYDFVMAVYYIELHGIAPNEVCDEGRMAAGLRVRGQE